MRIGLVVDRLRPEEKFLIEEAKNNNVDLEIIDSSTEMFSITDFKQHNFSHIDVFLQRCVSTLRGLYIARILEEYGFQVINDFNSSSNCIDKIHCSIKLAKANVPTPETIVGFTEHSALNAIKKLEYPVILKPVYGSWARLVAKINDEDAAKSIIEDRESMGAWYGILYLQKFVNKPNRDLRVTVIDGEPIAAIYRVNDSADWRTNTARGAKAQICEITPRIKELSINASNAMGEGIFGVDLMEQEQDFVVHEVNHSPEFRNVQTITGINVAGKIIEYAKEVGKK
ncbi:MAG: lysine biosynthesis protein LysX [archaeon]|nr:lysine biosynthesis protein LysX [archaeon]